MTTKRARTLDVLACVHARICSRAHMQSRKCVRAHMREEVCADVLAFRYFFLGFGSHQRRRSSAPRSAASSGSVGPLRTTFYFFTHARTQQHPRTHARIHACTCVGTCADMCADVYGGMCVGMCVDMRIDMCAGMCVDMCFDMRRGFIT